MVLPDLPQYIERYQLSDSPERAGEFMKQTGLGQIRHPRGIYSLLIESFGNSRHRWMWDFDSLYHELDDSGFQNIRRAQFGDARDPMFRLVRNQV